MTEEDSTITNADDAPTIFKWLSVLIIVLGTFMVVSGLMDFHEKGYTGEVRIAIGGFLLLPILFLAWADSRN